MQPFLHPLMRASRTQLDAVWVGNGSRSGAGVMTLPVGSRGGDLMIVTTVGTVPTGGSGATWATVVVGAVNVFWRTLTATDISGSISSTNDALFDVYRDPGTMALRVSLSHQGPPGTDNMGGFTKNASCAGRFGLLVWPAAFGANTLAGFTLRTGLTLSGGVSVRHNDALSSAGYTNNATTAVTWDVSDPSGPSWRIFEFLN